MPIVSVEQLKQTPLDYLIVGGGTSGLALATRLSEDKDVTVGVLEAGGNNLNADEINIPGYLGRAISNPQFDWTFHTVPQRYAGGVPILIPRGKGLGGSSAINFMGSFRPSKNDVDTLQQLGNSGWNWDSMLEYFKKFETLFPHGYSGDDTLKYAASPKSEWHGTAGPIKNSFPSILTQGHAHFFDAVEALGVNRNGEMADGSNVGSMTACFSINPKTAKRSYSASEYFAPNASRPNLLVVINAHVNKVILTPTLSGTQRAIGVELLYGGTKVIIDSVKKDVVLSTGSIQTPQILELSGIGSRPILESCGIQPIIDLPGVGENLQDHVCVRSIVEVDESLETVDVLRDPGEIEKHRALYKEGKGFLANSGAPAFLFVSSHQLGIKKDSEVLKVISHGFSARNIKEDVPSVRRGLEKQYKIQSAQFGADHLAQAEILEYLGFQPNRTNTPVPGKRYLTIASAIMRPLSRGSVHISSADSLISPAIDPKFFSNEADLILLVEALKFSIKLLQTEPLANVVRSIVVPGSEVIAPGEDIDERLREYVKKACGAVYHPVGTAAMLPLDDGGVVDSTLKVYGTENLRVVDVSILPMEVGTHIQSFAYAIAEKVKPIFFARKIYGLNVLEQAADMLKEERD